MGYAQTIMLVYGIKVDKKTAKKLYEKGKPSNPDSLDEFYFDNIPSNAEGFEGRKKYSQRYKISLYSYGTDSRCQDLSYEEHHEHYFGVELASNGYATSDSMDVHQYINDAKGKRYWKKFAVPYLKEVDAKIAKTKPTLWAITQVH